MKNQDQTNFDRERQQMIDKLTIKNSKLTEVQEKSSILQQRLKDLQDELQAFKTTFEGLTSQRDQYKLQFDQETQTKQRLAQELQNEGRQQREAERVVKVEQKKVRAVQEELSKCETHEATARNAELKAIQEKTELQAALEECRRALDQAKTDVAAAGVQDETAILEAQTRLNDCQTAFNTMQSKLDDHTKVVAIREKVHLDHRNLTAQLRTESSTAKGNLQSAEEELKNQKSKVTKTRTKLENQNITLSEAKSNWNRVSRECKDTKSQITDRNLKKCQTQSEAEKYSKEQETLQKSIDSLKQSRESLEHKIQQSKLDIDQWREQTRNIDHQYVTKQNAIKEKQIQQTSQLTVLETNEQQIRQQQQTIREQTVAVQRAMNKMDSIRANKANILKCAFELENDLTEQEKLLKHAQKEQQKLDEQHATIKAQLDIQEREKQEYQNDIRRLSNEIKQQQYDLRDRQESLDDLRLKGKQNESEITKMQGKSDYYRQQFETAQTSLRDINRKLSNTDIHQRTLDRDIKKKIVNQDTLRDLTEKKKIELGQFKQSLARVVETQDAKEKVSIALKKSTATLAVDRAKVQTDQIQIKRQLEGTVNRLNIQQRTMRHWEKVCEELQADHEEMSLQKPQQVSVPRKYYTEQYNVCDEHDEACLNQKRFVNRAN